MLEKHRLSKAPASEAIESASRHAASQNHRLCFRHPAAPYPQRNLAASLRRLSQAPELDSEHDLIDRFFTKVNIEGRHFALVPDVSFNPDGMNAILRQGLKAALDLSQETLERLFEASGVEPGVVDHFTSVAPPSSPGTR